jgi:hypothetical protein
LKKNLLTEDHLPFRFRVNICRFYRYFDPGDRLDFGTGLPVGNFVLISKQSEMKAILTFVMVACLVLMSSGQPSVNIREDVSSRPVVTGIALDDPEPVGIRATEPANGPMSQNFPNPFHGTTSFYLTLDNSSRVVIDIFTMTGQKVMRVDKGTLAPGQHLISLDGSTLDPGAYFYIVQDHEKIFVKRMIVR